MTSAQTVLLPGGMSAFVTVVRMGKTGSGPAANWDVEKTFFKSALMKLAQAAFTMG